MNYWCPNIVKFQLIMTNLVPTKWKLKNMSYEILDTYNTNGFLLYKERPNILHLVSFINWNW